MPEEEGNSVLFLQHSGPLRDTVQEESRTTPVPGKKKWRTCCFKLEDTPSHSLKQMGQQSKDQPVTETIRKDIDRAVTGTQTKPRAVPTGTQTEQEAVPTGTQTRKEVALTKTVNEKIHVIPFIGSQ